MHASSMIVRNPTRYFITTRSFIEYGNPNCHRVDTTTWHKYTTK